MPDLGADVPPADGGLARSRGSATIPAADSVAYASLLSAGWSDYLAHDNDGRPVIFIGHSQGAAMLIQLMLSGQIDPNPSTAQTDGRRPSSPGATCRFRRGAKSAGATFKQHPVVQCRDGQFGCASSPIRRFPTAATRPTAISAAPAKA